MVSMALVHLVATCVMVGVILFVQIVHYPLMARVGTENFQAYEAGHTSRTSIVVIPAMTVELGSALWVAALASEDMRPMAFVGLGLLAVIWLSTFLVQVPAHATLSRGFDAVAHGRLVMTNWIRTVAWLARVPVAVLLLG